MSIETETATAVGYIHLSQDGKSLTRQRQDVKDYATEHGTELVTVYNEGKRSSGFDTDRPEYTALREHVADGSVDVVIVPNHSRLSRARKERLRFLLDVDTAGVAVHSVELGRAVDLDDDGHSSNSRFARPPTTSRNEKRSRVRSAQHRNASRMATITAVRRSA